MNLNAFLDTNIFLHYQPVEQIDWLSVLEAEAVTLIIPPVVVRELDRLKDGPSGTKRAKERARRTLSKLNELWNDSTVASLRNNVSIKYHAREPNIDFDAHGLSRDWNDDQLIASVLAFRAETAASEVLLVTRDVGPKLKAQSHGIQVFRLPDIYELQDEVDPAEHRIRELERELREARSATPQLGLSFQDSESRQAFTLSAPRYELQPWLDREMELIRAKYPKQGFPSQGAVQQAAFEKGTVADLVSNQMRNQIPREEIDRYNAALDGFFARYQRHLENVYQVQTLDSRTAKLNLQLSNKGTAPADGIEVLLHLPDGFELFREEDLPKISDTPKPPKPPQTETQLALAALDLTFQLPYYEPILSRFPPMGPPPNVSQARIKRTNSYDVVYSVRRLNHLKEVNFEPLYVVFGSNETAHPFGIEYRILAENMPREVIGKLHVLIQRE
jgi:hypothetical protein